MYNDLPELPLEPPEEKVFDTCAYCGEYIYEHEDCIILEGRHYHTDCFIDTAASILLDEFGARQITADSEDY